MFYLESTMTWDLDVLVILSVDEKCLNPLKDIYEWARQNNFPSEEEYIKIEGIPVQFLPAYNELVKEAVEKARKVNILNTDTYVLTPEYLIAIMLQTGRAKDKVRVQQFFEEIDFDKNLLNQLLEKYSLKS